MGISFGFGLGPVRASAPLRIPGGNQRQHYGYTTEQYMAAARPGRPMDAKRALLIALGCLVLPFAVLFQVAMFAAGGFWAGFVWLLFQLGVAVLPFVLSKIGERQNRQRTEAAARADYEHAAIMRGDMHLGIYGKYPPAIVTTATPYAAPEPVPYCPN
jgi:hypothetical protein